MATKNLETVSGTVESINTKQTGLKVNGEWLNISQYHPIPVLPTVGQRVQIEVERSDRGAWINNLVVVDSTPTSSSSPAPTSGDREIRRQVAIKTAAQLLGAFAQCREEPKLEHLFPLADRILAWLEKPEEGEDEAPF